MARQGSFLEPPCNSSVLSNAALLGSRTFGSLQRSRISRSQQFTTIARILYTRYLRNKPARKAWKNHNPSTIRGHPKTIDSFDILNNLGVVPTFLKAVDHADSYPRALQSHEPWIAWSIDVLGKRVELSESCQQSRSKYTFKIFCQYIEYARTAT